MSKPTADIVITPNHEGSRDVGNNYNACWLGGPTVSLDFDSPSDRENWWMSRFYIDASWPQGPDLTWPSSGNDGNAYQGRWGRLLNWHNDSRESYLYNVIGASAFAVDYMHGVLSCNIEPEGRAGQAYDYRLTSIGGPGSDANGRLTTGVWHTIIVYMRWGRRSSEGTTPVSGAVKIWLDGNDTPVLDKTDIHTIYRYDDGSGFRNQRYITFWNGFYTKDLKPGYTNKLKMAISKKGATFAAMQADTATTFNAETIHPAANPIAWSLSTLRYSNGLDYSLGPATVTRIADTVDSDYAIPASLGGSGGSSNPPINLTVPTISGTNSLGQVLTRVVGTWSNSPTSYTYQWQSETSAGSGIFSNIGGATSTTYTVQAGDSGEQIRVVETATNADGSASATSPPVIPSGASITFGHTVGEVDSGAMGVDSRRGSAFQAGADIDITGVSAYLSGNSGLGAGSQTIRAVIYAMGNSPVSGGLPTTLLGTSGEQTVSYNASADWVGFTFATPVSVTSGNWYLLALHTGGTASAVLIHRQSAGGFFFFKSGDTYSGGADSTFGTPDDISAYNASIYAFGTAHTVPPDPSPTPNLRRVTVRRISQRDI